MSNDRLAEGEQRLLAPFQAEAVQHRQRADALPYRQGRTRRGPHMPRVPAPKPGTIAAVINGIEGCGPGASSQRAMLWARELFTPDQVRAWLQAGLRPPISGL